MPDLPRDILSMVTQFPQELPLAQAYLQPLDLAPGEDIPWNASAAGQAAAQAGQNESLGAIAFQYWPESLQDSRSSEWNPKNIPGGSHPIYQWTHGGERRLSFTAVFTTDTAPEESILQSLDASGDLASTERKSPYEQMENRGLLSGVEFGRRDVDLRAVVAWLRWFTYPYYGIGEDIRAYEPAKCLLVLPRTMLGHNGVDHIVCAMTQCDVTYEAWFPTGFPRIIEVALEFAELIQEGERVAFHSRKDMRFASTISTFLSTKGTTRG